MAFTFYLLCSHMHQHVKNLELLHFKNIESANLKLSPDINCFVGDNAQGKTNILDALYYCAYAKSYFNSVDSQNIQFEKEFFMVQAQINDGQKQKKLNCSVKKGRKKSLKLEGKAYEKLGEHIGLLPLVLISPSDVDLIHAGSAERRKFMDGIIAQYDKKYLQHLMQYGKIVQQRNAYLKQSKRVGIDADTILVYDEQLAQYQPYITEKRIAFIHDFAPVFNAYYTKISSGTDMPSLHLESKLSEASSLVELLQENRGKDAALQHTSVGVHRDDISFLLGQMPVKKFGSQGQQKTFLIALRLAQFVFLKDKMNKKPLLCLDDVFDKLDHNRVAKLLELITDDTFGQIFITHTEKDVLHKMLSELEASKNCAYFTVENGEVRNEA